MTHSDAWYIVKQPDGHCEIVPANSSEISSTAKNEADATQDADPVDEAVADSNRLAQEDSAAQQWGPFSSQEEAIARRVGLIRAGKCQPI